MSDTKEMIKQNWHLVEMNKTLLRNMPSLLGTNHKEYVPLKGGFYLGQYQSSQLDGSEVLVFYAKSVREFPIAGFNDVNQELIDTVNMLIGQEAAVLAHDAGYDIFAVVPDSESDEVHIYDMKRVVVDADDEDAPQGIDDVIKDLTTAYRETMMDYDDIESFCYAAYEAGKRER